MSFTRAPPCGFYIFSWRSWQLPPEFPHGFIVKIKSTKKEGNPDHLCWSVPLSPWNLCHRWSYRWNGRQDPSLYTAIEYDANGVWSTQKSFGLGFSAAIALMTNNSSTEHSSMGYMDRLDKACPRFGARTKMPLSMTLHVTRSIWKTCNSESRLVNSAHTTTDLNHPHGNTNDQRSFRKSTAVANVHADSMTVSPTQSLSTPSLLVLSLHLPNAKSSDCSTLSSTSSADNARFCRLCPNTAHFTSFCKLVPEQLRTLLVNQHCVLAESLILSNK